MGSKLSVTVATSAMRVYLVEVEYGLVVELPRPDDAEPELEPSGVMEAMPPANEGVVVPTLALSVRAVAAGAGVASADEALAFEGAL